MSLLPEVFSHIADIGRQLKSPRVGCIIRRLAGFTLHWSS